MKPGLPKVHVSEGDVGALMTRIKVLFVGCCSLVVAEAAKVLTCPQLLYHSLC